MDRNCNIGDQEATFKICFKEDGKEIETSGGQETLLYYEANINVNSDGSIMHAEYTVKRNHDQ